MSSSKVIFMNDVRLAWSDLFVKAEDGKDDKTGKVIPGKYGCTCIFDPKSEAGKLAQATFVEVAKGEFGPNFMAIIDAIDAKKKCIRNGNHKLDDDGNVVEGYKDMLYIAAKNQAKPKVVDQFLKDLTDDGTVYRGCYINLKVEISAYTSKIAEVGRCISAKVLAVQFARNGEAFGAAPPSADGFAAASAPTLADMDASTASLFG